MFSSSEEMNLAVKTCPGKGDQERKQRISRRSLVEERVAETTLSYQWAVPSKCQSYSRIMK